MRSKSRVDESICIRLSEDRTGFIYTVQPAGKPAESHEVPLRPADKEEPFKGEYYGGSQAID